MTTTIIYTCDRCQKPAKSRLENGGDPPLWAVFIVCEPIDHRAQYTTPSKYQTRDMCQDCVDKLGIMTPLLRGEVATAAPTIDDMVRAIIRDTQENGG